MVASGEEEKRKTEDGSFCLLTLQNYLILSAMYTCIFYKKEKTFSEDSGIYNVLGFVMIRISIHPKFRKQSRKTNSEIK